MENSLDRKVTLVAPGIVKIETKLTRFLFVFRFYESGKVRRTAAWKSCAWNKNKCLHKGFGEYDGTSTFYDLIRVYEAVVNGQEPDPRDLGWIMGGFKGAKLIEKSFDEIAEKFCS